MYPMNYYSLFPPFPRNNTVFVAMSFDPRFDPRWDHVIKNTIRDIIVNDSPLEPVRVDIRKISDSILTEILEGIGNARLFLADVTTIDYINNRLVRNGNVMYEIGIAHATRLPEEVLLFRSDNDELLFDVANVRVNYYNPDEDVQQASLIIRNSIENAFKELELQRHIAVRKAAGALDAHCWMVLAEAVNSSSINLGVDSIAVCLTRGLAITRLLEIGSLRTRYFQVTPDNINKIKNMKPAEALNYEVTEFGKAIFQDSANQMGILSPNIRPILEKML